MSDKKMSKFNLMIGTSTVLNSGARQEELRPVEFVGRELANAVHYEIENHGRLTNTRGVTETLYELEDGRLVVYVEDWSRWQTYHITEVTKADLQVGGRFEALGRKAGFGRPLTIDEALI